MNQINQGMGMPPMGNGMGAAPINAGPMNMMQQMIINTLYQRSPQFRELFNNMQGKTPEQGFQEKGLDYSQYQNIDPSQIGRMLGM